jgi:uncharacterized membrane protein (Fun14 family)
MNDEILNSFKNSDILSAQFLIPNVGAPFVIGMAVGYFAKKMFKLALFIGGGAIVLLFISEYYGFYTVSDVSLEHATTVATEAAQQSGNFLIQRLSRITGKGVSAVAGFYVGLKMG